MKFYRLILILISFAVFTNTAFSASCTMETSGEVNIFTGSWTIYDTNSLEIISGLGENGDFIGDINAGIAGFTFTQDEENEYKLIAEGETLDPTLWRLQDTTGRIEAFSGSCSDSIDDEVITTEDMIMLNIFEIAFFIVLSLSVSVLFIIKQI